MNENERESSIGALGLDDWVVYCIMIALAVIALILIITLIILVKSKCHKRSSTVHPRSYDSDDYDDPTSYHYSRDRENNFRANGLNSHSYVLSNRSPLDNKRGQMNSASEHDHTDSQLTSLALSSRSHPVNSRPTHTDPSHHNQQDRNKSRSSMKGRSKSRSSSWIKTDIDQMAHHEMPALRTSTRETLGELNMSHSENPPSSTHSLTYRPPLLTTMESGRMQTMCFPAADGTSSVDAVSNNLRTANSTGYILTASSVNQKLIRKHDRADSGRVSASCSIKGSLYNDQTFTDCTASLERASSYTIGDRKKMHSSGKLSQWQREIDERGETQSDIVRSEKPIYRHRRIRIPAGVLLLKSSVEDDYAIGQSDSNDSTLIEEGSLDVFDGDSNIAITPSTLLNPPPPNENNVLSFLPSESSDHSEMPSKIHPRNNVFPAMNRTLPDEHVELDSKTDQFNSTPSNLKPQHRQSDNSSMEPSGARPTVLAGTEQRCYSHDTVALEDQSRSVPGQLDHLDTNNKTLNPISRPLSEADGIVRRKKRRRRNMTVKLGDKNHSPSVVKCKGDDHTIPTIRDENDKNWMGTDKDRKLVFDKEVLNQYKINGKTNLRSNHNESSSGADD